MRHGNFEVTGVQMLYCLSYANTHIIVYWRQESAGPRTPFTPAHSPCTSWTLCARTHSRPASLLLSLCNLKTLAVDSFHSWQDCTSWWPWRRVWVRFIRLMWEGYIIIWALGFRFQGPRTGRVACFGES